MSSISVREFLSLCENVLYLCAGMPSNSEREHPLCSNVLYPCAGMLSISVLEYPLPLCGKDLYLTRTFSISARKCPLYLCGNVLYLSAVMSSISV
ncbi:hypothetical protein CDAR_42001 [Caerostris darwini]|uniref:Uncharacterized protein n=1 Tax=Caerostris darwini TaxID=1538125 RepID=A0AAV4RH46_9ARAC|nr:hypothetical protein CDAR_42001 [Caerostris darwini]